MKTVLYFGNLDMSLSRNKIYTDGLRLNGIEVLVCIDQTKGLFKYWRLFKKHWPLRSKYDVMIVGYPGYFIVPFAKLITRKIVIFDALCSLYETEILSHRSAKHNSKYKILYTQFIDWFATRCADKILVESNKQKEYFSKKLNVKSEKLVTVYTGADDSVFEFDDSIKKFEKFTVLFRGRITNEAGAELILRSAKILEEKDIDFLIIGYGWSEDIQRFRSVYKKLSPKNVCHIDKHLPVKEMCQMMQKCHISLGQFAEHERLKRTIPHKAYESLALKLPYITVRAEGISEVLQEGKHCLMVRPDDEQDLVEKILILKENEHLRKKIADDGYTLFSTTFSALQVVQPLIHVIE